MSKFKQILIVALSLVLWVLTLMPLALMGYSYVGYPLLMKLLARGKQNDRPVFDTVAQCPKVSILMSLYNEEKVILRKLESLAQLDYPTDKLEILIASDCSDDATNAIVSDFVAQGGNDHFTFIPNTYRQGKPGVINQLSDIAISTFGYDRNHVIISTDASVMLEQNVVYALARRFADGSVGLVDSRMVHTGVVSDGIAESEDYYISSEVKLKQHEALVNGKMMGPFGGCYAVRSDLFAIVPPHHLVDDFFITMHVFKQGYDAIVAPEAVCTEAVSQDIDVEFGRKRRIAAGNYQNLSYYREMLLSSRVAFNYWSHKVIRWLGPLLLMLAFTANVVLAVLVSPYAVILFALQVIVFIAIPMIDVILSRFKINIPLFRSMRYFVMMHVAMLAGFVKYVNGIQSGIWQRTERV